MSLASVDELAARVGEIALADVPRAQACLDDATALVESEAPSAEWTSDSVPASVKSVVLAAAGRVFRNPGGFTSQSVGGRSESYSATSLGAYLMPAERATIRQAVGRSGLTALRTWRDDEFDRAGYLDIVGSDRLIRWFSGED